MTGAIPGTWPNGAALFHGLGRTLMEVILHLGAHRTATTTFQHYVRDQMADFSARGMAYWGPQKVRKSVFPGLLHGSAAQRGRNLTLRAEGRVRLFAGRAQAEGTRQLLVSDENMLGTCIHNLRRASLYPAAGERTARISAAFGGQVRRIVLSIRSQDLWWASACAMTVARGHPVPSAETCRAVSGSRRCWRDVITDIACAAPRAEIVVLPFERYTGRPDVVLRAALGHDVPRDPADRWLNRSGDLRSLRLGLVQQGTDPDLLPDATGRWNPFTAEQTARLAENYADDMHWLLAGADGLATLTENTHPDRAETHLPPGAMTKGQENDQGQGKLAQGC